jgi:ElaB/YqjD/DUF883 family membrane-anchored ribosome-binding protein
MTKAETTELSAPNLSFATVGCVPEEHMTTVPRDAPPTDAAPDAANDDAFRRLEKEMAAMKNTIGELSHQIADAASDIGTVAQDQATRSLKHARANVDSMVADASNRVSAVANVAQSQVASIEETLEDVIRERPLSTVALALGLGFLVGVTWRR